MTTGAALVVEDGATHTALPAVRALAADGWRVGIAAPRRSYAAASRAVAAFHPLPALAGDPAGWTDMLARAAAGYDVVVPAGDAEVVAVSVARDRLPAVPLPPHDVVLGAIDKLRLAAAGAAAGFAVPRTTPAEEYDGRAPVVVKARHHYLPGATTLRWPARLLGSPAAVRDHLAELAGNGVPAVVQDVVAGDLVHVVLLRHGGRVVTAVQQVADRVWPAGAGDLVRGRTVAVDQDLLDCADRLLATLGWEGLAQLELLRPPGGQPRLVDLNGRVYGSAGLATAAGVPFPALLARAATGRPVPAPAATVGVRWSALGRDLRGARGAVDALGCVRAAATGAHAVWSVRDPLPSLVLAAESGRRLARRLAQRRR